MYGVKDTVSEKLSRLFSASPSKSVDQQSQVRPYTKEGKSVTSFLSFLLPSTYFANTRDRREVKPLQSNSFTWRSKSFSLRNKPLDDFEVHNDYKEIPDIHPDKGENGSIRSSVCVKKETVNADNDNGEPTSETFEDAPDRHSFEQSLAYLTTDSVFITPNLYDFFQSSLPNIVKGCQWVLLYRAVRPDTVYHSVLLFARVLIFLVLAC